MIGAMNNFYLRWSTDMKTTVEFVPISGNVNKSLTYTEQGHNLRNIEEIKSLLNLKFQTFKKTQVMT